MTDEVISKYPAPVKVAGIGEASLNFETAIYRKWGEVRLSAQDPVTKVVWEMAESDPTPSGHPHGGVPTVGEGADTNPHKPPYVTRGTAMSKLAAEVQGIRAYYAHRQEIEQPHMRGLGGLTPYYAFLATAEYNRPPSGVQDTQRINLLEENRILKKELEKLRLKEEMEKKAAADRLKAKDYSDEDKEAKRDARKAKAEEMGMDAKDFSTMEMIEKLRGQYGKKGYGGRESRQTLPVAALLTQDYVKERILASQSAPASEPIILDGVAKAVGE